MITTILNLVLIMILGIVYIFSYANVISNYLEKTIANTKNPAMLILYFSAVLSAGVNLFHVSETASNAFVFFMEKSDYMKATLYSFGFVAGMWVFSFLFFLVSFFLVGVMTPKDEKYELGRGSYEMAGLHSVILIVLSFVIAPALISLASQFIPYPELPF